MFAERLRELRKAKKISQGTLAAALGVSQQAVGKWETQRSTPDPATVARIATYFGVTADYLLGCSDLRSSFAERPKIQGDRQVQVPVVGSVRAGYGSLAFEEDLGYCSADVRNPGEYFYLMVRGDSMEPRISEGDLALVRRQPDVESGQLAVVLINGEEGTLKKIIKKKGTVILQPFNPAYPAMVYVGQDLEQIQIVGKVIETKTRW